MRRAGLALVAAAVVSATAAGSAGAGRHLVTIDSFGLWTLERLGYGQLEFPVTGPLTPGIPGYARRVVSCEYLLPRGAHQGPRTWYLIHLHFRIVFSPNSADGEAYVEAETGRAPALFASAQIIFKVSHRAGKLWITSDALGLVAGHRVRQASSRSWTITFDNYIGYGGIRPGRNVLDLILEETKGVRVQRLVFFRDSGIRYSPYSPAQIRLSAKASTHSLRVGRPFSIDARIRNTGGRNVKDVLVRLDYPRERLELRSPGTKRIAVLKGRRERRASFVAVPRRAGSVELTVEALGALSNPVVELRLRAAPAPRAARHTRLVVAAAVAGGLLLLGALSARTLRRRQ